MSSRYLIPLALAAALVAPIANADVAPGQSKGDWIFRAGLSQVNPTASPGLKNPLGNGVDLTADSDVSLTGTIAYMLTDHIGTELLLAWPFKHGIDAKFPGGTKQRVGYAELLPPTLNLQWYFRPDKAFNPYVGAGVNWTIFTSSELRKGALGLPQNAKLETSDSFGGDVQIGADYYFSKHWLVNGDVRYIGLTTDVDVKNATSAGGTAKLGKMDINPMVYTVAVGYRMFQPAPVPVAAPPPPPPPAAPAKCADGDGDGVCDADDKCPGTPAGTTVDKVGCPCSQELKVLFDFDKAELRPESITELERVVKFMNDVPFATAKIDGHTDSVGSEAYNMALSDRRAKAVFDYLTSRGVDPARLKSQGFGETNPIATNDTAEGRQQNRRVMLNRTDSRPN
jgi:OOP family OmpA-OmpF porin